MILFLALITLALVVAFLVFVVLGYYLLPASRSEWSLFAPMALLTGTGTVLVTASIVLSILMQMALIDPRDTMSILRLGILLFFLGPASQLARMTLSA